MKKFEENSAVELRENVSETQTDMYKAILVRLMERSNNNPELVNAMRDFIRALDTKSWKGDAGELMDEGNISRLT